MKSLRGIAWPLGHFHNKKAAQDTADKGDDDQEYDDRQSIFPFTKEERDLECLRDQRKSQEDNDDTTQKRDLVVWTRRLAYTTGALAFATVVVASFAGWQAWETRSGANQQHRDSLAALGRTDAQIATMQTQAEIMRGQLQVLQVDSEIRKSELAAKVDFHIGEKVFVESAKPIRWEITVVWENKGKTDAMKVTGWNDFHICAWEDFPSCDPLTEPSDNYKQIQSRDLVLIQNKPINFGSHAITIEDAWNIIYRRAIAMA
jgi:hypothetical protein